MMPPQSISVTINGTGFAADYTARTYGMIPHKNGVSIQLAGVTSGQLENAERFAEQHQNDQAYGSRRNVAGRQPDVRWNETHPSRTTGGSGRHRLDAAPDNRLRFHDRSQSQRQAT